MVLGLGGCEHTLTVGRGGLVWRCAVVLWLAAGVDAWAQEGTPVVTDPPVVTGPAAPPPAAEGTVIKPEEPAPSQPDKVKEWPRVDEDDPKKPRDEGTTAKQDPPTPAPLEAGWTPVRWSDAPDVALDVGEGSMELCEAITFPLGLIPSVGTVLGIVAEWSCIIPGALSVDHVERFHGERDGLIWQSAVALTAMKLWRDLTRWPVVIAIGAAGLAVAALAVAAAVTLSIAVFPFSFLYLPVVFTGVLTGMGVTYILARKVRKTVAGWIFHGFHALLTPKYKNDAQRLEAQKTALVRAPMNVAERAWFLGSVAAGVDGEHTLMHLIPVVGPMVKAWHHDTALKDVLRRVSKEEFQENRESWTRVDATISTLTIIEGTTGALAHAGLIAGGIIFAGGTGLAAFQFGLKQQALPYAVAAGSAGIAGMVLAGGGLLLLGIRELAKMSEPVLIPLMYGIWPDGPLFPKRANVVAAPKPEQPVVVPPPVEPAPAEAEPAPAPAAP